MRIIRSKEKDFNENYEDEQFSYFEVDEEAAESVPCSIDGIDATEGVKNSGGTFAKYVEVLRLFCIETNVLASNLMGYYLYKGEMFRIKLHGLKNSCNCIGAVMLADEARELERKYVSGENIAKAIEGFCFSLFDMIERIATYVDGVRLVCLSKKTDEDNREACMIPGIPREEAAQLRESMLDLELEDVVNKINAIRKKKYSSDIEIYLDRIVELVNRYDFDSAIEVLARITEEI